jgi:hypothetical protein
MRRIGHDGFPKSSNSQLRAKCKRRKPGVIGARSSPVGLDAETSEDVPMPFAAPRNLTMRLRARPPVWLVAPSAPPQ